MLQGNVRTGKSKIDGFIIGEVIIDRTGNLGSSPLSAYFALADSRTLTLFGKTKKAGDWSQETLQKLAEFLQAVENDIAKDVLDGESNGPTVENTSNLPLGENGIPEL